MQPSNGKRRRQEQQQEAQGFEGRVDSSAGLRRRPSPSSLAQGSGRPPAGLYFDDEVEGGGESSRLPPYHPDYGRHRSDSMGSDGSSQASSTAEDAGVVDAGCIPPTLPHLGTSRQQRKRSAEEVEEPEEHELLDRQDRKRWIAGPREFFPRLFAEESASEDDDSIGGSEGDSDESEEDEDAATSGQRRQNLRTRVRRGSEGYEVRPMTFDYAYQATRLEEEERIRQLLMRQKEEEWEWMQMQSRRQREEQVKEGGGQGEQGVSSAGLGTTTLLPSEAMAQEQEDMSTQWALSAAGGSETAEEEDDDDDDYGQGL